MTFLPSAVQAPALAAKNNFPRATSFLALVFFFSGFSSLIYQVVWQRLLTMYYGVGAISMALIVSIYMAGLGLGALLGGFLAERFRNRMALYLIVELLIGCFGWVSLPFLDFLGQATAGSAYFASFFYISLFLSVPTLLMGITLPLVTKIFHGLIRHFFYTVSFLYFINTLGAAAGAVYASYVIISFFGLDTAIYAAVAINFILAVLIFLSRNSVFSQENQADPSEPEEASSEEALPARMVCLLVLLTGFLAIGYEMIWFRLVGVLIKDSPYAFSSILSVYLLGIALGSLWMKKYLRSGKAMERKSLFFSLQFLIGISVMLITGGYYYLVKHSLLDGLTANLFAEVLRPPVEFPRFSSVREFLLACFVFFEVFLWPMIFVLLPSFLMGASFPLISSLAYKGDKKTGQTIGTVYFFNIAGNVLGGILTGFLILPALGTEQALLVFSSLGLFLGLFVTSFGNRAVPVPFRIGAVLMIGITAAGFFPQKGKLYAAMHGPAGTGSEVYFEEGINGIVMTYNNGGKLTNYINGLEMGVRPHSRYYFEAVETLAFAPEIQKVLIIGYGAGAITEVVLKSKEVKHVTVVELSGTLMKNLRKMNFVRDLLADKRLDLIIDDGRRYLLRTNEKYDLILMDPIRTSTSYANNLHSREFFELASRHLNPKGMMLVGGLNEVKVLSKTVLSVFPHMRMYDFFCLASHVPLRRNAQRQRLLLARFSEEKRQMILQDRTIYFGDQSFIRRLTEPYPINQKWKPVTEYYLGVKLKEQWLFKNR